jgi:hypothetical protein
MPQGPLQRPVQRPQENHERIAFQGAAEEIWRESIIDSLDPVQVGKKFMDA